MKMSKQTATEWLFAHLLPFLPFSDPKEREHFRKCLAEAKVMEKEQIIEAFCEGYDHDGDNYDGAEISYYNRTYKRGDK
jgi:hypothetical protein